MKTALYLHGKLARHGGPFRFYVKSPIDLIQALACQHPAFASDMKHGHYHLVAGPLKKPTPLSSGSLYAPCEKRHYHLYPDLCGAGQGRGKMVLGLTLLGLSFVPGVATGIGQFGTSITGNAQFGAGLAATSKQLLARSGQYIMAQGVLKTLGTNPIAPDVAHASHLTTPQNTTAEGIAIPLIYGKVRLSDPVLIETGLHVETVTL